MTVLRFLVASAVNYEARVKGAEKPFATAEGVEFTVKEGKPQERVACSCIPKSCTPSNLLAYSTIWQNLDSDSILYLT